MLSVVTQGQKINYWLAEFVFMLSEKILQRDHFIHSIFKILFIFN